MKINPKPMGHNKSSFKSKAYSDTSLPRETKISNKPPILIPKATRVEQKKPSWQKEIIKLKT